MEALAFLISGVVFGLAAGMSPGPLLALIISETLKNNKKAGIKVALAPLFTDLPIILVTTQILSRLSGFNSILGYISILGAIFIGYLACENIFAKEFKIDPGKVKSQSLKKGIIVNFLNPNPYIFWFSIGAPTVLKALDIGATAAILFVLSFYTFLVGSGISVAMLVEKYRSFLESNIYSYILKIVGMILLLYALIFLRDGLKLLGIN